MCVYIVSYFVKVGRREINQYWLFVPWVSDICDHSIAIRPVSDAICPSAYGDFPNFYAVNMDADVGRDNVLFDIDARTYRLFVSEEDATVRWQECIHE